MVDKYYKLQGSDDVIIEVEESAVMMSTTLREKLAQNGGAGGVGGNEQAPIKIPSVTGDILRKVFVWCEHHSHDVQPGPEPNAAGGGAGGQAISAWDKDFLHVELGSLSSLLVAARDLGIQGLSDICTRAFAQFMCDLAMDENVP